jgi:hypothetical protein
MCKGRILPVQELLDGTFFLFGFERGENDGHDDDNSYDSDKYNYVF